MQKMISPTLLLAWSRLPNRKCARRRQGALAHFSRNALSSEIIMQCNAWWSKREFGLQAC